MGYALGNFSQMCIFWCTKATVVCSKLMGLLLQSLLLLLPQEHLEDSSQVPGLLN